MSELAWAFLPECPRSLRDLREAVEENAPGRLEQVAHRLRGSGDSLLGVRLASVAG